MTQNFGIDTSVLVRLATGLPAAEFQKTLDRLVPLVEKQGSQIVASNQVIGEAYIALQHHYGVEKLQARAALLDVLRSGLVEPLRGKSALDALSAKTGCGLMDRLIASDYDDLGFATLTLDKKMAKLPNSVRL